MDKRKVRVRFAPSPTGPLHIGGVRTALYNYLFAKKHNGDFILRIEDTDQTRFVPGAEEYIIESLKWCGITVDEGIEEGGPYGPYRQSDRKEVYKEFSERLIESGNAYYAFDTAEELDAMRERLKEQKSSVQQYNALTRGDMKNSLTLSDNETAKLLKSGTPFVVRFKMNEDETVIVEDIIRGKVTVNTNQLDDKVLFKSDGMPTYHLANVVDDHLMKISHVIRGEEWLPSLPLHVLLYRAFGWEDTMPDFAHLPLLLKPSGQGKLSKRDGDALGFPVFPLKWEDPSTGDVSRGYREDGYFPDAFVNLIAFLGWNPGTEEEILSINEMASYFDLNKVHKAGAKFDPEKAKWFNHKYLTKKNSSKLAGLFQEILKEKKNRIILIQKLHKFPETQFRSLLNGALIQDRDIKMETEKDLNVSTKKNPTKEEIVDLLFANKLVKHSKSNTIILAKNKQLCASGVGQTSRVDALKQAIDKANQFGFNLKGAVMASDAFFPFPDCVEIADKAGVVSVIQPGGSVKDKDSIDYCDLHNISMVLTGTRHFKH